MSKCKKCIFIESDITHHYKKGAIIFSEGEDVNKIFSIKEGIVKVTKLYPNGEERLVDVLNNGDFLALLTVVKDSDEYMVSATALTDIILTSSSLSYAKEQYKTNIDFMNTCMKCASNRLSIFQRQLFDFSGQDVKDNIMNLLNYLYKKFGYTKNNDKYLKLPITKMDLANMLGLRRETLSRKLKELHEEGIITLQQNIIKFSSM